MPKEKNLKSSAEAERDAVELRTKLAAALTQELGGLEPEPGAVVPPQEERPAVAAERPSVLPEPAEPERKKESVPVFLRRYGTEPPVEPEPAPNKTSGLDEQILRDRADALAAARAKVEEIRRRHEKAPVSAPPETLGTIEPEAAIEPPLVEPLPKTAAPEAVPPGVETPPEQTLEQARAIYIREYQEYQKSKKPRIFSLKRILKIGKGKEELPASLEEAKAKYEEARAGYARRMYEQEKQQIEKEGLPPTYIGSIEEYRLEELMKYRAKLFSEVFLKEQETLKFSQIESYPPKERGIIGKLYQNWVRLPKGVRWAISATLATGFAVGTGVVAGGAAVLMFAGYRYGRAALATFTTIGAERLATMGIKGWEATIGKKKTKEYRLGELEKSDWLEHFEEKNVEFQKILEETAKRERRQNISKWVFAAAAGGGAMFAGGMIDQALGFTKPTVATGGGEEPWAHQPPKMSQEQIESLKTGGKSVPPQEAPEAPARPSAPAAPEAPKAVPPVQEAPAPLGATPENFVEVAHKGDSIWKMAERQLAERYGQNFTGLNEAQKTYIIDAIKDRVAENPENFGLTDVDKIKIGQNVDFSSIFKDEEGMARLFSRTGEFTPSQIKSITEHNAALRDWVREHPGEQLTSQRAEEILSMDKNAEAIEPTPPAKPTGAAEVSELTGHRPAAAGIPTEAAEAEARLDELVIAPEESVPQEPPAALEELRLSAEPGVDLSSVVISPENQNFFSSLLTEIPNRELPYEAVDKILERINAGRLKYEEFYRFYADTLKPKGISNRVMDGLKKNFDVAINGTPAEKEAGRKFLATVLLRLKNLRG